MAKAQIIALKDFIKNYKLKLLEKEKEEIRKMFEVEGKRLASLNLSPSQLDKYVELKHNWNTLHTQRMKEALKVNNQDYNILHNQLTKQMNVDLIYPIFDHDQLKKYKEVLLEEQNALFKMRAINEKYIYKTNYNIELSETQVALILELEDNNVYKDENGDYYSEFELEEIKYQRIKSILDQNQLEKYYSHHLDNIAYLEDSYKKQDLEHSLITVNILTINYNYYVQNIQATINDSRKRVESILTEKQKNHINNLRESYLRKLDEEIHSIEQIHYRHNKELKPNELLQERLQNKMLRTIPFGWQLIEFNLPQEILTKELTNIINLELQKFAVLFENFKLFQFDNFEKNDHSFGPLFIRSADEMGIVGFLLMDPGIKEIDL